MYKWLGKLAVGGLCIMTIAIIGFFTIVVMNVDCDGYACVGYLIILGPMFLLGFTLIIIAAIVAVGNHIYSLLKK
jgi:hypothetical protein